MTRYTTGYFLERLRRKTLPTCACYCFQRLAG